MATQKNGGNAKKNPTATKPATKATLTGQPEVKQPNLKLLDVKGMDTAIKSISVRSKKLDTDVQQVALSAIDHCDKHGDVVFINRLYLALGKGARKRALVDWFLQFGKVGANDDNATKKDAPFKFDREKTTDLESARRTPWYDFAPEPTVEEIADIVGALHRFVQRFAKADKVNDPALLGRLLEIDEQITAGHTVEAIAEPKQEEDTALAA